MSEQISELNKEKRLLRKKETAEDFTPSWLVNEMLDKLPESMWEEGRTFCDPACGNGNMLIEVLKRKLSKKHNSVLALKSIYGADIKDDNINECRLRLLKTVKDSGEEITKEHIRWILRNLRVCRLSKFPEGSLNYDFSFKNKDCYKDINFWYDNIKNGILENIEKADMDIEDLEETELEDENQLGKYLSNDSFDECFP